MTKTKAQKARAKASKKGPVVIASKSPATGKTKFAVVKGSGDYRPTSFSRVRGKGDYFSDLGGGIGRGLGSVVDVGAGLFKAITGMGDYRERGPRMNSLHKIVPSDYVNPGAMTMGAMNAKFNGGVPRICHREYLGPVMGGTGFTTRVIYLQPGIKGLNAWMPWGSAVANCFQQYKLHGALLEYVSTSSNYSSTSALGTVSMSTLYDAGATPLSTMLAINNNEYTTTTAPDKSIIHPLECASADNAITVRYVRESNSTDTADERFEDVGIFQLSTNGLVSDSTVQIGELWCSYDIEFLKPKLPDYHVGTSALWTILTAADGSHSITPNASNSLPAAVEISGNTFSVNMPVGYNGSYLFLSTCKLATGTTSVSGGQLSFVGSDLTGLSLLPINTSAIGAPEVSGTGNSQQVYAYTFSTIAETPTNNFFNYLLWYASAGSPVAETVIVITAMDNDIVNMVSGEQTRLLRRLGITPQALRDLLLCADESSSSVHTPGVGKNRTISVDSAAAAVARAQSSNAAIGTSRNTASASSVGLSSASSPRMLSVPTSDNEEESGTGDTLEKKGDITLSRSLFMALARK